MPAEMEVMREVWPEDGNYCQVSKMGREKCKKCGEVVHVLTENRIEHTCRTKTPSEVVQRLVDMGWIHPTVAAEVFLLCEEVRALGVFEGRREGIEKSMHVIRDTVSNTWVMSSLCERLSALLDAPKK